MPQGGVASLSRAEGKTRVAEQKSKSGCNVESMLSEELERLQRKLGLSLGLRVVWMPNKTSGLSGEVRGGSIYIYEAEEDKAIQALKHELIDFLITSKIVKPLVDMLNILIKARESEIYKEKEKIVEIFSKIV